MERIERSIEELSGRRPAPGKHRVRTFIDGFDDALSGGIPVGHVVILHGPAGAMKTSLALYIASKSLESGMKPLFVSLEETRESLGKAMGSLGIGNGDFIVDIATMRLEHGVVEEAGDWFEILRSYLAGKVEEGLDILIIDSINSLYPMTQLSTPRRALFHFFKFLRNSGMTSFLIYEGAEFPFHEEHMVDGLIEIAPRELPRGEVALWARCVKLRQSTHSRDYHRLEFQGGRFRAFPVSE